MKINWRLKLSSRKLWMSVVAFVSGLMLHFGASPESAAEVGGLIMSGASVLAYVFAEAWTDTYDKGDSGGGE